MFAAYGKFPPAVIGWSEFRIHGEWRLTARGIFGVPHTYIVFPFTIVCEREFSEQSLRGQKVRGARPTPLMFVWSAHNDAEIDKKQKNGGSCLGERLVIRSFVAARARIRCGRRLVFGIPPNPRLPYRVSMLSLHVRRRRILRDVSSLHSVLCGDILRHSGNCCFRKLFFFVV